MKLRHLLVSALALTLPIVLARTAAAALVISFGAGGSPANPIELLPNTPNQQIQLFVIGGDPIQNVNFNFQINDGGVAFSEFGGNDPIIPITALDIITGTVFDGNNTGQNATFILGGIALATTTTNTGTVVANGLLGTITVDTTGIASGASFGISTETLNGPLDFEPSFSGLAPANATVTIIPEPASLALIGLGSLLIVRRKRAA